MDYIDEPISMDYIGKTIYESLPYQYCQQVSVSPVHSNIQYAFSWTVDLCLQHGSSAAPPVWWLRRRLLPSTFVGPLGFHHNTLLLAFRGAQKMSKVRDWGSGHSSPWTPAFTYSHRNTFWFPSAGLVWRTSSAFLWLRIQSNSLGSSEPL